MKTMKIVFGVLVLIALGVVIGVLTLGTTDVDSLVVQSESTSPVPQAANPSPEASNTLTITGALAVTGISEELPTNPPSTNALANSESTALDPRIRSRMVIPSQSQ